MIVFVILPRPLDNYNKKRLFYYTLDIPNSSNMYLCFPNYMSSSGQHELWNAFDIVEQENWKGIS